MSEKESHAAEGLATVKRRAVRGRTPWRRIYSCIEPSSLLYADSADYQGWDARFNNFRRYEVAGNYHQSNDYNNNKPSVKQNSTRHIMLKYDWSDVRTLQNRDVSVNFASPRKFLDLESVGSNGMISSVYAKSKKKYDVKAARRRRHTVSRIEYTSPFQPISEANEERDVEAAKDASPPSGVNGNADDCGSSDTKTEQASRQHSDVHVGKQEVDDKVTKSLDTTKTKGARKEGSGNIKSMEEHKNEENIGADQPDNQDVKVEEKQCIEAEIKDIVAGIIDHVHQERDSTAIPPESILANEENDEVEEIPNVSSSQKFYVRRDSEPVMNYTSKLTKKNSRKANGYRAGSRSPTDIDTFEKHSYKRLYQLASSSISKNSESRGKISDFLTLLQSKGIWPSDPRLKETYAAIRMKENGEETELSEEVFTRICSPAVHFIRDVLLSQMTIPGFALFGSRMSQVYHTIQSALLTLECNGCRDGTNVDPTSNYLDLMRSRRSAGNGSISMSVCTVDGQRLSFGDRESFHSLDACANVLNYCIACRRNGIEVAKSHIGKTQLRPPHDEFSFESSGKVLNPFTKAGAIVTTALLSQNEAIQSCLNEIHDVYSKAMGEEAICCDNLSYNLKRFYAHEEISLAYFLSARQKLPKMYNKTPGDILELNFQSSSTATTSDACSVAAATLATGGVCPLTGEVVFKDDIVKHVLKRMRASTVLQCKRNGKESDSISFTWSESGAMFLVVPGVLGMACFVQSQSSKTVSEIASSLIQNLISTFNFSVYRNLRKRKESDSR